MSSASEVAAYFQQAMPKLATMPLWYGKVEHKENLQMIVKELEKKIYEKVQDVHVQSEIIDFINKEWINVQKATLSISQYLENIKCFTLIKISAYK